jgi:quercetin dioxygenase-like cupin family protein
MKTTRVIAVVLLAFASALALQVVRAQQAGSKRTDLQRHDLSAAGREVIQVRVDFDPGHVAPMHTHTLEKRLSTSSRERWSMRLAARNQE